MSRRVVVLMAALASVSYAQYTINTVAGNGIPGFGGDGGPAMQASFNSPTGLALDSAGNLFVADKYNYRIRKITPAGVVTTFAGNGIEGFGGDGGPAVQAQLGYTSKIALDGAGSLFIADQENNRIRKVTPDGIIATVAGNGVPGFAGDGGPAAQASLNAPSGVAVDLLGNLLIADTGNQRIRKVTPDGMITTVAGNGVGFYTCCDVGDGSPALQAFLYMPQGVGVDQVGNLLIADTWHGRIRKVTADGIIHTVAGGGGYVGFSGDGGPATQASLYDPVSPLVNPAGNLFFADCSNSRIRRVDLDGIITTVAGNGNRGFSGDSGPALQTMLNEPFALVMDTGQNILFADYGNNRIRRLSPSGPPPPPTPVSNVILLTRDAADDMVTYFRSVLTNGGISYTELLPSQVASANLNGSVIVGAFASIPTEFAGPASTAIAQAVTNGSWLLAESYGIVLLSYAGVGTASAPYGQWCPLVYDTWAYVNNIDNSPLFTGLPTWDPPAAPDRPQQFMGQLSQNGCKVTPIYTPPSSGVNITQYWFWQLGISYGWAGQSVNSSYCLCWGGCTPERSVNESWIQTMDYGGGKIQIFSAFRTMQAVRNMARLWRRSIRTLSAGHSPLRTPRRLPTASRSLHSKTSHFRSHSPVATQIRIL